MMKKDSNMKNKQRVAREKGLIRGWHGYFSIIPLVAAIAVMLFIFIHSAMPAKVSYVESRWFVDFVSTWLPDDVVIKVGFTRKVAHFIEYLLLGLTLAFVSVKCSPCQGQF